LRKNKYLLPEWSNGISMAVELSIDYGIKQLNIILAIFKKNRYTYSLLGEKVDFCIIIL